MKSRLFSTAIALVVSFTAQAGNSYIEIDADNQCDIEIGWAWDCQPTVLTEESKPKAKKDLPQIVVIQQAAPEPPKKDPNDPLVWLEKYQEEEQRARARMLMEPSMETVEAYRRDYFEDTMDRGTLVSDYWRRIAWTNPDLDYTAVRPANFLGKREFDIQREKAQEDTLKKLNERYGLFFVFESTCSSCLKYAPVLDSFAQKHGLHVEGISRDGKPLRTWTGDWKRDENGAIYRMGVEEYPSPITVLFDSETGKPIPIGVGVMAHDELAKRIHVLTEIPVGEDY
ncbi:conjugal transfer protein TraF [Enterovibrio paralichthyis]|uniref:conjugal transfer protein TraF n=1 Tax=Enterovibrio paralichthyis TaxID=2853805 RepID=UPI001C46CF2D|nr:conjugal transfer protein TraF [Enterovibrio paralichthyis]MBV7300281.1 conjugal transfer protein TraF [Enterovibrio paralichthyis]